MKTFTIALLALCVFAAPARAQNWNERAWVTVSGGLQKAAESGVSDTFDMPQYTETGQVRVNAPIKNGGLFAGSRAACFGTNSTRPPCSSRAAASDHVAVTRTPRGAVASTAGG